MSVDPLGVTDPRDEDASATGSVLDPTPADAPCIDIDVTAGPDEGLRATFDAASQTRALVGKSPSCDVRLTDPLVSRRHLALEAEGAEIAVIDLGSKNGTFVDGVRVRSAFVRGGETIRIGETALTLARRPSGAARRAPGANGFGRMLGASEAMRRIYPMCERLAAAHIPVLIEGETGTGKELLAEALHELGPRADKPFVVFDCTTAAPSLIESELFGHERGAFTGASTRRRGVFELADGGTLFIDEIGELDLALQSKLLRAIERTQVRRVGGDSWIRVDVRVIAATRRNLDDEIQAGRFRDDLYFRLAVGRVELPPLRARQGDVPLLAQHFWREHGGSGRMPPHLVARFEAEPWAGNVRELSNAVARALALGDLLPSQQPAARVPLEAAPDPIAEILARDLPLAPAREQVVAEFERRYVERVLDKHEGNVTHAARASGIARRNFQKLRAKQRGEEP